MYERLVRAAPKPLVQRVANALFVAAALVAALCLVAFWGFGPVVDEIPLAEADRALGAAPWRPWNCEHNRGEQTEKDDYEHRYATRQRCDLGPSLWQSEYVGSHEDFCETRGPVLARSGATELRRCTLRTATGIIEERFEFRTTADHRLIEYRCVTVRDLAPEPSTPTRNTFALRVRGPAMTLVRLAQGGVRVEPSLEMRAKQWPPYFSALVLLVVWRLAQRRWSPSAGDLACPWQQATRDASGRLHLADGAEVVAPWLPLPPNAPGEALVVCAPRSSPTPYREGDAVRADLVWTGSLDALQGAVRRSERRQRAVACVVALAVLAPLLRLVCALVGRASF